MDIFFKEHRQLLRLLVKHNVSFILIGGYAVNYYGYERTTGDMDIWLELGNENKYRVMHALKAVSFKHLPAPQTALKIVCRLLLLKKKKKTFKHEYTPPYY